MGDPIQALLATCPDAEPPHACIPEPRARCCCGNEACAFLKHTQNALDGLEKDVSTAARLGKALLMRHETFIADSERERKAMTEQIETLETEKRALERSNAATIEENRTLLDQLEAVNSAVADSDEHIISLQATLQSTQEELRRLQLLATRTEGLERQIVDYEREQVTWHASLEAKELSEKSAVRRWQAAERTLAELHEQIERIEREANEERRRHDETVERMARRHAVEKELGSAASRLKGAAAAKATGQDAASPNVVSHFVKDLLQDNANLQLGIVELREMLNTSNDEVEKLRSQLTMHQPAEDGDELPSAGAGRDDLRTELTRANSQEVHVHHHYHAPPSAPKTFRRKKRILTPGHHTPRSGTSTPHSSISHSASTPLATILRQTTASVPQPVSGANRWSVQSTQTCPSLASSPQSMWNRSSSIYERVFSDAGLDSSRPSTPDTEDFGSPMFGPSHSRKISGASFRSYTTPIVTRKTFNTPGNGRQTLDAISSVEELRKLDFSDDQGDRIPEEGRIGADGDWENATSDEVEPMSPSPEGDMVPPSSPPAHREAEDIVDEHHFALRRPALRRIASHESVLSVGAMDIHTLKSRPSQLLAPYGGRGITSEAVISDTTVHAARPVAVSRTSGNSRIMLSGMASDTARGPVRPTLGRKFGGWVLGKWGGAAPAPTSTDTAPVEAAKAPKPPSISSASNKSAGDDAQLAPFMPRLRSPGVNQSGPILGFGPEVKVQHAPVVNRLDEDALRTALGGE